MTKLEEKYQSRFNNIINDTDSETETSKEDWNKFVIASSLCCIIILVQIVLSFYEF